MCVFVKTGGRETGGSLNTFDLALLTRISIQQGRVFVWAKCFHFIHLHFIKQCNGVRNSQGQVAGRLNSTRSRLIILCFQQGICASLVSHGNAECMDIRSREYIGICLKGLGKTTKILDMYNRRYGRYLHPVPKEFQYLD